MKLLIPLIFIIILFLIGVAIKNKIFPQKSNDDTYFLQKENDLLKQEIFLLKKQINEFSRNYKDVTHTQESIIFENKRLNK